MDVDDHRMRAGRAWLVHEGLQHAFARARFIPGGKLHQLRQHQAVAIDGAELALRPARQLHFGQRGRTAGCGFDAVHENIERRLCGLGAYRELAACMVEADGTDHGAGWQRRQQDIRAQPEVMQHQPAEAAFIERVCQPPPILAQRKILHVTERAGREGAHCLAGKVHVMQRHELAAAIRQEVQSAAIAREACLSHGHGAGAVRRRLHARDVSGGGVGQQQLAAGDGGVALEGDVAIVQRPVQRFLRIAAAVTSRRGAALPVMSCT